ncbi:DUF4062 domain-containing protein [Burkholderia sp. Bp9099]|uniref:DUF4062 domain-containing protein n=1 Tax=Burkholderia sp. Bp9099 TaxID=2184568 RepID=UPI000F5D6152|nr:DUF4062 domain-containing protein [Burkholderia sp. Bp9099]RQZ52359.1 DUF4062 domain-containing protein [Burkholderia sp. Bp9099]
MQKKYQVFVSSTYTDLKDERQHVIQALMEMDCIPAGMELFPAADEQQWEFIKRVIDDCDYYILIIGNRYGSLAPDGISYTEKEFDYAASKGIKVVALIHGKPNDISFDKSEQDPTRREKLKVFIEKVSSGRLVKYWTDAKELPGAVALSLNKTIMLYPAVGWVRASQAASAEILLEINNLRNERERLIKQVATLETQISIATKREEKGRDMASLDDKFSFEVRYSKTGTATKFNHTATMTWRSIFAGISPFLESIPNDKLVNAKLGAYALKAADRDGYSPVVEEQAFRTIALQLKEYGLVNTSYSESTSGAYALFWQITKAGERLMRETRLIRRSSGAPSEDAAG